MFKTVSHNSTRKEKITWNLISVISCSFYRLVHPLPQKINNKLSVNAMFSKTEIRHRNRGDYPWGKPGFFHNEYSLLNYQSVLNNTKHSSGIITYCDFAMQFKITSRFPNLFLCENKQTYLVLKSKALFKY
jgi:hypothetical protein